MAVAWDTAGYRELSRVESIALGGLFISTKNPPREGTTIRLLFDAPGGEVRARAIVRNLRKGRGMGIEIIAMQPEHRARLSQCLKKLSVDSQALAASR